jgi:sulfoxide reductase heme-binding subunit YedZ
MTRDPVLKRMVKPAVFLVCLVPAALLAYNFFSGNLSFNPIDDLTGVTGRWTLRFLLITLAVTPARRLTGFNPLVRFRRMMGLFTFFYALLHVSVFVVFDFFFDFAAMLRDIPQRPFITAGFIAFASMAPLALTSTNGWIRRLGGKRWQMLHRLVYVSGVAGAVHYFWVDKVTEMGPTAYLSGVLLLLGYRAAVRLRRNRPPGVVRGPA